MLRESTIRRLARGLVIAACASCAPSPRPAAAPATAPDPPAEPPAPAPRAAPASLLSAPGAVPSPVPAAAGRAPAPARAPNAEAQAMVDAHNRVRAKHCAPPLTWSTTLATAAQRWANALRDKGCAFEHSRGKYGENLAAGTTGTLDAAAVVGMWYDEVAQYQFPDGGFSMATGHFTQVVWRGTSQVGCGRSHCNDLDIFVCEYDPPGNWEGQYRDNVKPTGCKP